jgi:hypothetical protein
MGFLDECAFKAGGVISAGDALRLHNAAMFGTPKRLDFHGRDGVVRFPYAVAYDRIASTDPAKAVKTWTYMWRFETGNYLRNYVAAGETNSNRRMVLFQWGNDPALPQIRASILFGGTNHNLVVETTHNGTVSTMTSSTNLAVNTRYTFWVDRSGTALRMFLNDGTSTIATATISSTNNGFGTGTTGDIFIGAGVSSAANAAAYSHEKFFYGRLEEVRIYARRIEDDARITTYAAPLSKADIEGDTSLIFCAQFPEGVGPTTTEASKTANVGILTRDFFHSTTTQWSAEKPIVWRAGFMTPVTAPPFNGLGSYVKGGASSETLIGVAAGIAYEIAQTLTEQAGTVALEEAISDNRPFSAVALGNRLYLADGRNTVAAVENGVVRPCGIPDLPGSAVPGVVQGGPGALLGFYAYAVQLKSAFTGALSRPVKTPAVRFRNERALVGFGTTVPGGQWANFNPTDSDTFAVPNLASNTTGTSWTVELQFRAENVMTERGEARTVRLDGSNDAIRSGATGAQTIDHPLGDFTYEIRYQWVTNGTNDVVLDHARAAGNSVGTLRIVAAGGVSTDMLVQTRSGAADVTLFTVGGFTTGVFRTMTVVHRGDGWEYYTNGDLIASVAANPPDAGLTAQILRLGERNDSGAGTYGAIEIGEFRLWSYARSATQIQEKFRTEITDATDLSNLALYWKMNDGTGNAVTNSSTRTGSFPAQVMDGGSAHGQPNNLRNPTRQTIINTESGAQSPGELGLQLEDIGSALVAFFRADVSTTPDIFRLPSVTQNKWYHVAVSRDDTTNEVKVYVDKTLVSTTILVDPLVAIGTDGVLGSEDGFFDGDIDEVRVWNVVRTAAEIAANADIEIDPVPTSLVHYYKLNGNGNGSAATPNNLTGANPPTFVSMTGGQIPLGDLATVTARRIYRSAGSIPASESTTDIALATDKAEAGPFYLVKEIDDNTATQLSDGVPDTDLVIVLDEDHAGPPPIVRSLTTLGNRLVGISSPDAKSSFFVSANDSPENFDIVGDSDTIADAKSGVLVTGVDLTGVTKQAILFTETAVGIVTEGSGGRLETALLATGVGCVGPLAAVRVNDTAFFWDRRGPHAYAFGEVKAIYEPIQGAVQADVLRSQWDKIIALHHYPRRQVQFLNVESGALYKYDYNENKWMRDTGTFRSGTSAAILQDGITSLAPGVFYGDTLGYALMADRGNIDGWPLENPTFNSGVYLVVSALSTQVTVSPANLPTTGDGLKGLTIRRVSATSEENATVTSNTTSVINISGTWATTPLAGDAIAIGPIAFKAESGWWDGGDSEQGPATARKRFGWLTVHFDTEKLSAATTVTTETAVRERGYYGGSAYDQTRLIILPAAADSMGAQLESQPVQKIYVVNGLGRFFKYRITGERPSGWGFHQVDVEFETLVGAF